MKFQDDMNTYTHTHIHTDKPKPICPPLFQSWGHKKIKTTRTPYVVPLAKDLHQASEKKFENVHEQRQWIPTYMLDHPITVVVRWYLMFFGTGKLLG